MVCTDSVIDSDVQLYNLFRSILIIDSPPGTEVIGKGRHVFPFSFHIPDRYGACPPFLDYLVLLPYHVFVLHRQIPSTFKACVGKVVHKLKAELKQSMKLTKKAKTHFTFVSKPNLDLPSLMVRSFYFRNVSTELEQLSWTKK